MRSNAYATDPLSERFPVAAVCGRGDLIPRADLAVPKGCYDTKVTSWSLAWGQEGAPSLAAEVVGGPTLGGRLLFGAGEGEGGERVAAVDGDQCVAFGIVGQVQRDGEVDREIGLGEPADAGDDADGRDGEAAGADPDVVVDAVYRIPGPVVVRQRFAHPHVDDVGQPSTGLRGPANGKRIRTSERCFRDRCFTLIDVLPLKPAN